MTPEQITQYARLMTLAQEHAKAWQAATHLQSQPEHDEQLRFARAALDAAVADLVRRAYP